MNNITEILAAEFSELKAELTAAYLSSGRAASGKWADNLEVQATADGAALIGESYINGRKPGTPPPTEAIEQWIISKGIAARLEKDMSTSSLAYLIARKVARQGWLPHEKGIVEQVVTPERIQRIIDKAGHALLDSHITDIINQLKSAAA